MKDVNKYIEHARKYIIELMGAGHGGEKTTQSQLAEAIGTTQPNLSKVLSDSHNRLTVEQYLLIAEYFGISLDDLFGNTQKKYYPYKGVRYACQKLVEIDEITGGMSFNFDYDIVGAIATLSIRHTKEPNPFEKTTNPLNFGIIEFLEGYSKLKQIGLPKDTFNVCVNAMIDKAAQAEESAIKEELPPDFQKT